MKAIFASRPARAVPLILIGLLLSPLGGCVTRGPQQQSQMAAVAPVLSVERFLQAANSRDFQAMARLFGTADGPVSDTGSTFGCFWKKLGSWIGIGDACVDMVDVELRMNAIAQIIRHEDYQILSDREVPGRRDPTIRVGVTLVQGNTQVRDVPFNVVRTGEGRWLVQEIGLDKITERG